MYPIIINLHQYPVLVVGGGNVAKRKIDFLLEEKADVTVISPKLHSDIKKKELKWLKRRFEWSDLNDFSLIFACTDDKKLNNLIKAKSRSNQLVNNTSDKSNSDFYNMKVINSNGFLISISSRGNDYRASKKIGDKVEEWLNKNITQIIEDDLN